MILLSKSEVIDYKLESDDAEDAVVFKLKKINSIQEVVLFDKVRTQAIDNTEASFLYTQRTIVGIENLKDENGDAVEFETEEGKDYISTEMLGRIPASALSELTYKSAELGGLLQHEKK